MVAQHQSDGAGLRAVLAPACVRGVGVQPVLLRDHLNEGIQRNRVLRIILSQVQESPGELLHPRDALVSLLVGRDLPESVRRIVEFLEQRLVLLCRRGRLVLAFGLGGRHRFSRAYRDDGEKETCVLK
jgi:hypothetical protein